MWRDLIVCFKYFTFSLVNLDVLFDEISRLAWGLTKQAHLQLKQSQHQVSPSQMVTQGGQLVWLQLVLKSTCWLSMLYNGFMFCWLQITCFSWSKPHIQSKILSNSRFFNPRNLLCIPTSDLQPSRNAQKKFYNYTNLQILFHVNASNTL